MDYLRISGTGDEISPSEPQINYAVTYMSH